MRLRLLLLLILALLALVVTCKKDEDNNNPSASITVTSPNGGETWNVASSHAITWTDNEVTTVNISLSTDGGSQWTAIASNVSNNSYSWTVPASVGATCRIRVADASDGSVYDDSDANFAIAQSATDNASGPVNSDQEATIESPGGARIVVPQGAVPRYENGDPGTMVFSIELDNETTPTPPAGQTVATPAYRFGPGATVFALPVEISIPLLPGTDPQNLSMIRINPGTNLPEVYPSHYDSERHAIVTQAVSLSMWFGAAVEPTPEAWGCVHVENLAFNTWFTFCVDSFVLEYPSLDLQYMPEFGIGGLWAPPGHIGITNISNFRMPQGTYWICTQYGEDQHPNNISHGHDNIVIADPWNESQPEIECAEYITTTSSGPDTGRCMCNPTPTIPVGTGAVQVSLTWYVADVDGVDLDLHLIEPGAFEIYFGAPQSPNGGLLDHDDTCGDFRNGTTENIFYSTNPPIGEYIVKVHYWGDCGEDNHPTQAFAVRTVVQGQTQTFERSVAPNEMLEITRFSITGAGPAVFLPVDNTVTYVTNLVK